MGKKSGIHFLGGLSFKESEPFPPPKKKGTQVRNPVVATGSFSRAAGYFAALAGAEPSGRGQRRVTLRWSIFKETSPRNEVT